MHQAENETRQAPRNGNRRRRPRWFGKPKTKTGAAAQEKQEEKEGTEGTPAAPAKGKEQSKSNAKQGRGHHRPDRSAQRPERAPQKLTEKQEKSALAHGEPAAHRQAQSPRPEPVKETGKHPHTETTQLSKPEAPRTAASSKAAVKDADHELGPVLITRRPPAQKYANFEEYVKAHEGFHVPQEDETV